MRRNTEEVKAELCRRLDEYNEKRRRRRAFATLCVTVCLTAAVTVAAVPAMIAGEGRGSTEKMPIEGAPATDKADDIISYYSGGDGAPGKQNSAGLSNDIDGTDKGFHWGTTEDILRGMTEGDEASPGTPSEDVTVVTRLDRDGNNEALSAEDAAAVIDAVEALELKKAGDDFGSLVVRLDIKSDELDVGLELNDRNEAIVYAHDGIYVAENTEKLISALKNAGVIE